MKYGKYLAACLIILMIQGCALLQEKIDGVKLLKDVKFEWIETRTEVSFLSNIFTVGANDKFNVDKLDFNIVGFVDKIRQGELNPSLSEIKIFGTVEATNPNKQEVELLKIDAEIFLDDSKIADLTTGEPLKIQPEGKATTVIEITMPESVTRVELANKKKIRLEGEATMNIEVLNQKFSAKVPFSISADVPKDQIDKAVEEQKQKLVDIVLDYIKKATEKLNLNNLKDLFN